MAPEPPPRAPKTSPSLDLHRFFVDLGRFFNDFLYHVGYFLSGLPHYFFGYLELSFSNFWPQVQMCWGRPQGSVRSQKNAMRPTLCLACLVFRTSSPTFQVSGHKIFGVVSRVISELGSTARWRECRRQVDISDCRFHILYFRFRMSAFRFQISDYFQISGFVFHISYFRFQISDFRFHVSYF